MKKQFIIGFIIGALILGIIGAGAALVITASEIPFSPSERNRDWEVDNLESAVNDLYEMSNNYRFVSSNYARAWNEEKYLSRLDANNVYANYSNNGITIKKSGKYIIRYVHFLDYGYNTGFLYYELNGNKVLIDSLDFNPTYFRTGQVELNLKENDVIKLVAKAGSSTYVYSVFVNIYYG